MYFKGYKLLSQLLTVTGINGSSEEWLQAKSLCRMREPDKSVFAVAGNRDRLGAWVEDTELMKLNTSKMTRTTKKCRNCTRETALI